MRDPRLQALIRGEFDHLGRTLREAMPTAGRAAADWLAELRERVIRPRFFPIFDLPWWVERSFHDDVDVELQADLVYSTAAGYCCARLIDDVMDAHPAARRDLLPATALFHVEFQQPYVRRFDPAHPFWALFRDTWFGSFEAAVRDAALEAVERREFEQVAGLKLSAIRIPGAAVCYLLGREEQLEGWCRFCDLLARLHQLADDLSDWRSDREAGRATWFLTEGERRKESGESLERWVVREGFAWAASVLDGQCAELVEAARELRSDAALRFVEERRAELRRQVQAMAPALEALATLAEALKTKD